MSICYHCGAVIENLRPGRSDECPGCRRPLRVCRNCRFYDPQAETVGDKEKPNFCEWFRFGETAGAESSGVGKDDVRQRFDALFRREKP